MHNVESLIHTALSRLRSTHRQQLYYSSHRLTRATSNKEGQQHASQANKNVEKHGSTYTHHSILQLPLQLSLQL